MDFEPDVNLLDNVKKLLHEDESIAELMLMMMPMVMEGKPWGIIEPEVMRSKEMREVGTKLNQSNELPIKLFALKNQWGLLWGYDLDKTVDWYKRKLDGEVNLEELFNCDREELWKQPQLYVGVESSKAAEILPNNGDIVGLFNISDEYTVVVDQEGYPQWGLSLRDVAAGTVKPWGMSQEDFEENKKNLTYLLRNTQVSAMGDSLLFEWEI